jgi:hypothetical protein
MFLKNVTWKSFLSGSLKTAIIYKTIIKRVTLHNEFQMKKYLGQLVMMGCLICVSNIQAQQVELSGPRIGFTVLGGESAELLEDEFGAYPIVTQFGWQFERRFFTLDSGSSGLVESVILLGGLEQGILIPSWSGIIGFRDAKGTEFGLGPNISPAGIGLTFAVGVTLNIEDKVNIPFNLAVSPINGIRISLLTGFNSMRSND